MKFQRPSLIVLCGPSGIGKSHWAEQFFQAHETISSDYCRYLVSGDENDQSVTNSAFLILNRIVEEKLINSQLTVVDSTALRAQDRIPFIELAHKYFLEAYLVIFRGSKELAFRQNELRERTVPESVIEKHFARLETTLSEAYGEGWDDIFEINVGKTLEEPTFSFLNEVSTSGPFDCIGDLHGSYDELIELLETLGYITDGSFPYHPNGRVVVFVGDYTDRGPYNLKCLDLARRMVDNSQAIGVLGNHDSKLKRALRGNKIKINNGLNLTLSEMYDLYSGLELEDYKNKSIKFLESLPYHLILDKGNLVIAHAGIEESMIGQNTKRANSFCLYGDKVGEAENGTPIRRDWAQTYRGKPLVVYGHTVTLEEPQFINNTLNIDTGCVFGNRLTCLRYPEMEIVSVKSRQPFKELTVIHG